MPMQPYVVCQGDHLKALADAGGFDADTVWNDSANADLKKLRGTYNVLLPGDILQLPVPDPNFLTLKKGQDNPFTAPMAKCKITHVFLLDGEPLASAKYKVLDSDMTTELAPGDSTDGDGKATFEVPVQTDEVWLSFDGGRIFRVAIGHLDPAASASGAAQRLQHLGYLDPNAQPDPDADDDDNDWSDDWVSLALAAFQTDNGLDANGTLDDKTVAKLVDKYGI
jgi:hypothetical protein